MAHRQRGGLLRRGADVGGGPGRGAADGRVPRDVVLDGDLQRPGRVAEGVLAGHVVAGDEDDGDAVLGDDMGVEQALAGADAVRARRR